MNRSYTLFISFVVALGGFLLGFDSAVISGAVSGIRIYFEMSDWELGFSVGCVIFGAMAGNIVAGPMSDRFGRKKVLLVTAMLFTVSALWSATATTYVTFVIARIIGGIGIGGAILIAPIYIAEIAPPKLRGSLVSLNQLNIVVGISVAYFSNYFLKDLEGESWRWMLGVETIPAFIYFLALFTVPRSPRWLIQKLNLVEVAKKILIKIGGKEYAEITIDEIQRGIAKKQKAGTFADLFSNRMATIMIIAFGIAFFQQITGINAIFYYAPTIFEQAGGSTDSSFLQAIVVGLTNLVFTLVAIRLIDKLGRKPLLIIGTSAMTIALTMATMAFKAADEAIVLIGATRGHVGSSLYSNEFLENLALPAPPPPVDLAVERRNGDCVRNCIQDGLVSACHDISDGGLFVAVAEMALAGNIGARIELPGDNTILLDWLFGEDQARYIVTVADPAPILAAAKEAGVPAAVIGRTSGMALTVAGDAPISLDELRDAHEGWLPRYMAGP